MEALVETILANLPVGLLVLKADGTIVEASSCTCDILGCPEKGFVGKNWGDIFIAKSENVEFSGVVLDAIQKETPTIKAVTPYRLPDGEKKYLSVISSVLREEKKLSEIVIIIEDLTELNHMHLREKAILEENHKLATQRADSLIAFARSVAHQIRNPVMAIGGLSRIMERMMNEKAREPLEAIKDEAHKLETMVKSVAEYSAISLEKIVPINLWLTIEEAKHRIANHPAILEKNIQWQADCPDINIKADRDFMTLALSEIFLNSAEFGGPDTTVSICAKEEYPHIIITISDSGPGFTQEGLKLAFDPFFTTKTVGTGMGLPRTKRIINEHQGSISIANQSNGGAQVVVSLPVEPY